MHVLDCGAIVFLALESWQGENQAMFHSSTILLLAFVPGWPPVRRTLKTPVEPGALAVARRRGETAGAIRGAAPIEAGTNRRLWTSYKWVRIGERSEACRQTYSVKAGILCRPIGLCLEPGTVCSFGLVEHKGRQESAVGVLRVMSRRGDDRVTWDQEKVAVGDPEALAAIREAERIFAQERARGATAFKVETGKAPQRLETFDPQAEQIVMIPRVVGG